MRLLYTRSTLYVKVITLIFMLFPANIFKAYDIRGLVEGELSDDLAYAIGRAFVQILRERGSLLDGSALVVGYDMRPTSPVFAKKIMDAMTDEGISVVNIGMTTTPVFNFACANDDHISGGIMVTASHNPAEYNGFKLTMHDGLPIGKETGMDRIKELVEQGNFLPPHAQKGTVTEQDVRPAYIEKIFSFVDTAAIQPLKIVVDAGNGMGKASFPLWLETLPVEVEYLYLEPDGTFPNHEANPLKEETLHDLQAAVRARGADFGFALDGDADRIGLVDNHGNIVDPSLVSALIGQEFLRSHPHAHMLYDLRSSQILKEVFESQGATTQMCMVGHANIKKMMRETQAQYASELSLHIFFGPMYYLESTDLCLLYLLQRVSREQQPISDMVAPLQRYAHSGEINFTVEEKDAAIERLRARFAPEALEVSELDGLWMRFDWGWCNVRKSNTEPVLRLNLESASRDVTNTYIAEIRRIIESG